MNPKKIKTPINPYSYVGIVYDKIKKENKFHENKEMPKKIISSFTVNEILSIVANHWGVEEYDIINETRKQERVDARYTFFAALKLKYDMNMGAIGQIVNNRHHTSVIHGLRAFHNRYHKIENFRRIADEVFAILGINYNGKKLTQSLERYESKNRKRP